MMIDLLFKRPTVGVTRWWAGRDHAALTELTSSHTNCLKTRRLPPPWPRCFSGFGCTLCWAALIGNWPC